MTLEKAIIECQQCSYKALSDMDRLWSRLSKAHDNRSEIVKDFLRLLNRASPAQDHDPSSIVSSAGAGIFNLPLVRDQQFYAKATELLAAYDNESPAAVYSPPLWLRLIPGWRQIMDALGLTPNLIAVSVAVNNGGGGVASSSVVLNSKSNLPDLSALNGASGVRASSWGNCPSLTPWPTFAILWPDVRIRPPFNESVNSALVKRQRCLTESEMTSQPCSPI